MRISKLDKTEKKQRQFMKEMEASLALYITEVQEENDRLIEQLSKLQLRPDTDEKPDYTQSSVPLEDVSSDTSQQVAYYTPKLNTAKVLSTYRAQQKPKEVNEKVQQTTSIETEFEKVYRMRAEGFNSDEIASRLKKGKTEVELILKFKQ